MVRVACCVLRTSVPVGFRSCASPPLPCSLSPFLPSPRLLRSSAPPAALDHNELMPGAARQALGKGVQVLPAAGGKLIVEPTVDSYTHSK